MPKNTLRIINYTPSKRYMHGLTIGKNLPPEYSTFLSGKEIGLLDREGHEIDRFQLNSTNPIERSYEIIVERARTLNRKSDKRIINETVHPPIDITNKL